MAYNKYKAKLRRCLKRHKRQQRASRKLAYYLKGTGQSMNVYGPTKWQRLVNPNLAEPNVVNQMMRRATGYRGEGDYWTDLRDKFIPKGTFSWAGRTLGGMSGVPGMDAVGSWAGNKISKYVGFGDYTGNAITEGGGGPSAGITVNASDDMTGDLYFSHKEFVSNITVSINAAGYSAFNMIKFALNPGLSTTFPFLSQLAQNYELYDFQGLIFEYKPTSGEGAGSTNALGKVIMATQYDPDAADWLNSIQMQNYDYANSTKPSMGAIHGVETKNSQQAVNMMYTRTASSTKSKVFTDLGNFYVATEGIQGAANSTLVIGELWVTYRVKLSRANLYNSILGLAIPMDWYRYTTNASFLAGTRVDNRTNNAGLWTTYASNANSITFQGPNNIAAGCYNFNIWLNDTGGSAVSFTSFGIYANTHVSQLPITGPLGVIGTMTANKATTEASGMWSFIVKIDNPSYDPVPTTMQFTITFSAAPTVGSTLIWSAQQTTCNAIGTI